MRPVPFVRLTRDVWRLGRSSRDGRPRFDHRTAITNCGHHNISANISTSLRSSVGNSLGSRVYYGRNLKPNSVDGRWWWIVDDDAQVRRRLEKSIGVARCLRVGNGRAWRRVGDGETVRLRPGFPGSPVWGNHSKCRSGERRVRPVTPDETTSTTYRNAEVGALTNK